MKIWDVVQFYALHSFIKEIFADTYLESQHKEEATKVVVGEPILENPCSYDAMEKI
jgi:hypothetical protein